MALVAAAAEIRLMPSPKRRKSKGREPPVNFIRDWRKNRGLTLEELGARSGLGYSTISQIERRRIGFSWESLEDIAIALECTTSDLLSGPPAATEADILSEWRRIAPEDRERAMQMLRLLVRPN